MKKIPSKKNSYIFRKWNFLALILRYFWYFLKINLSLYFWKWNFLVFHEPETPQKFSYFTKWNFFAFQKIETLIKIIYISGNRNPKKLLIFLGAQLSELKKKIKIKIKKKTLKKFLIFEEIELSYFWRVPKNKFIHSSS